MTGLPGTHCFTLYRSGYHPEPLADNQLWAEVTHVPLLAPDVTYSANLYPRYGSAASYYHVELVPYDAAPEDNWASFIARLQIDGYNMGSLPLSWYVGEPADWSSGVARYPESEGFRDPANPHGPSMRGVWSLHARRSS